MAKKKTTVIKTQEKDANKLPIGYFSVGGDGKKVDYNTQVATTDEIFANANINEERASRGRNYPAPYSAKESNNLGMTYRNLSGKQMIQTCLDIYKNVGIVKNVEDLMADFCTEGIEVIHPNKGMSGFWKTWVKKADINSVSNKMALTLLKAGNLITKRRIGKLKRTEELEMRKEGKANVFDEEKKKTRIIPIGYTVKNPLAYRFQGVRNDGKTIIYDMKSDRIDTNPDYFIDHYKKDDWEEYGYPFHYAALDDIAFEYKMRRMDESAMDGIINKIRLWKIGGTLKDGTPIFPQRGSIAKLANILTHDTGGGTADIIWDQFIDLKTEETNVDKILGSDKYNYIKNKILEDFGIAQVLISGSGEGSYSNQYLSIAGLIEKLEYIRGIIQKWLEGEIRYICKNLNIKKRPTVRFNHIDLSDKNAERALVLQLKDRGLISKEQTLTYFSETWDIEKDRITNEYVESEENDALENKGPYDIAESDDSSEEKPIGKQGGDGRPSNQPGDKSQKTTRKTKPQGASYVDNNIKLFMLEEMAIEIQDKIANIIDPVFLVSRNVKNIKQLTKADKELLENSKFFALCNANGVNDISKEWLQNLESTAPEKLDRCVEQVYRKLVQEYVDKYKKQPSKEMREKLRSKAWSYCRKSLDI